MLAWMPTYFTDSLSLDLAHAAQVSLLPPVAAIAASALAGPSADALIARGVPVVTVRCAALRSCLAGDGWHPLCCSEHALCRRRASFGAAFGAAMCACIWCCAGPAVHALAAMHMQG